MSKTPVASLATIGNLCDILRDLPLASPTDYAVDDEQPSSNIKLIDSQQQFEKISHLLNSTDPYLVDILNRTLNQIDTSKITLKPSAESQANANISRMNFPPLLQSVLACNPKLFNGSLTEHALKQRAAGGPSKDHAPLQQQQQQLQSPKTPGSAAAFAAAASFPDAGGQMQQQTGAFVGNNRMAQQQQQTGGYNHSSGMLSAINPQEIQSVKNSLLSGAPAASVEKKEPKEEVLSTSKFYSKSSAAPAAAQPVKMEQDVVPAPGGSTPKKEKAAKTSKDEGSARKKAEKAKNALSTWQADITSQLALPQDFTPELISQLAAEGYDVVTAGGRKARSRQQSTIVNSINCIIDSSDEDESGAATTTTATSDAQSKPRKPRQNADEASKSRLDRTSLIKTLQDIQDPFEHPSFKRFCQIVDDLLDVFDQDLQELNVNRAAKSKAARRSRGGGVEPAEEEAADDDQEIPAECLISRQTCSELVQEAFKLNTFSIMHAVKKESLAKLQSMLFFNIKDGIRAISFGGDEAVAAAAGASGEQEKLLREILVEKLLRASDCSIISLIIMTSPKISKELVVEDIIEQIALFLKSHLTDTIFPFYDPVYKVAAATDAAASSKASSKRKLLNQFSTSAGGSSSSSSAAALGINKAKHMQHFYNRIREILSIFADLVCQIDMTDTIVITLTSLSVMCFFVENINDLQLEALKILTNIFTRYPKHRQLIFDDILSSLIKLHPTKRNARSYKCFNGDSILMFSALVLQLIQCEVNTIDFVTQSGSTSGLGGEHSELSNGAGGPGGGGEAKDAVSFEEKETYIITAYEGSCETAKKFLSVFFSKCKTKQADSDFRPVLENFIQDLLTTVNKPEWPVSEIILNLLGIILVSQIQNEQNDVGSRVNSLEYLGQIVSQLRKDTLEYQKFPERVLELINKALAAGPVPVLSVSAGGRHKTHQHQQARVYTDLSKESLSDDEIFVLQRGLIRYLESLLANDSSMQYAKYFQVGQWLKELNRAAAEAQAAAVAGQDPAAVDFGQERVEKHAIAEESRRRLYDLIERGAIKEGEDGANEGYVLSMAEAFILSKYLCSLKKSLDKNFDYYLVNILSLSGASSDLSTPTQVRSKAIKCLSLIIEADPQILLKAKVFSCVEANFLHQTISVREASVDLIGRFITLKPELTNHYYKLLSDRILDVGVSVRKRVIKIFRDICLNQPEFEHLSEICVKILRRINDEEGIKKLVIDTFYSVWFAPLAGGGAQRGEQLLRRVLNLVDVVSEFNTIATNAQSTEIFEQLFNSLISTPATPAAAAAAAAKDAELAGASGGAGGGAAGAAMNSSEQEMQIAKSKEVIRSCKMIVDCLIENVLNTEANTTTPQAYKRLVASFSTLYLLSKIKPENFITHAETLLPYLNIKSTNQNDNQIINSAAKILECVIPLLQSPSNSFLISLEESLCKLIFQGGMMVVSSCISCLGTVVNKLTKNYKLAADCFLKFYNNASFLKKTVPPGKPLEPQTKPLVYRVLFTLGLLSKNFDVESEELAEYKVCSKQDLFALFFHFIRNYDAEVQQRALTGLGSFLSRYNDYMMKDEVKTLYLNYIKGANVPYPIKSQVFLNLTDYLNEEDQRNLAKSIEISKHNCKDDLKEMLDVQSGMASTIIQAYLKPILDSYLTHNQMLRLNIFNCLSQILTQGLVYPIECVPYLIAMTTDPEKKIQTKALSHLTTLQKAHPGFVQSKSIAGVNVTFMLQKIIKKAQLMAQAAQAAQSGSERAPLSAQDSAVRGFIEQSGPGGSSGDILSLNHHLYTLLRVNRSYRRAFSQQLLKLFDDSSLHHNSSLAHMLFIADNLAYFPYQLMDEPLFIIHQIDMIISVTGVNLLQTFKENLLNHQSTAGGANKFERKVSSGNIMADFDMGAEDCPDEENLDEDAQMSGAGGGGVGGGGAAGAHNQPGKRFTDDDDEETFELVLANMPENVKPLRDCMYKAQGCCLLLILKHFLKEIYTISDNKIQNYSPTDTAKVNDRPITSRRTNRRFNPKQIIEYMSMYEAKKEADLETKEALAREYLEFKELMLSIDQEDNRPESEKAAGGAGAAGQAGKPGLAGTADGARLSVLQQKLFEGIEKTKSSGAGGADSTNATPRGKSTNKVKRVPGSSAKKSTPSKKRKRRNKDSDSDDSDFMNDDDEAAGENAGDEDEDFDL